MLEKTPKNSLRVPFLNAVFPQALFVYLYREPRESAEQHDRRLGVGALRHLPAAAGLGRSALVAGR